jgi:hypothetical protein
MFDPGLALVRKKSSPSEQVAGAARPVFMGLVAKAPEKSTDLLCVRRSTWV